jgi:hypothetical protein
VGVLSSFFRNANFIEYNHISFSFPPTSPPKCESILRDGELRDGTTEHSHEIRGANLISGTNGVGSGGVMTQEFDIKRKK